MLTTMYSSASAPAAFSPGDVLSDWADFRTADGLWQDTGETMAVAATGDVVGAIVGRKGLITLAQGTAGSKLSWHESGYLYATGSTGSKSAVSSGEFSVDYTAACSLFFCIDMDAGLGTANIGRVSIAYFGGNVKVQIQSRSAGGNDTTGWATQSNVRNSTTDSTEKHIPPGRLYVFLIQDGASSAKIYVNGAAGQSVSTGLVTGLADYITYALSSGKGAKGIAYGISDTVLSADDMANIRTYFAP